MNVLQADGTVEGKCMRPINYKELYTPLSTFHPNCNALRVIRNKFSNIDVKHLGLLVLGLVLPVNTY